MSDTSSMPKIQIFDYSNPEDLQSCFIVIVLDYNTSKLLKTPRLTVMVMNGTQIL